MSGRPSKRVERAMKLVRRGWSPYRAANHVDISLSTIYRSKLYIAWRDGIKDSKKRIGKKK